MKTPPLVILGLDAADPNFICRWAKEGYLPTIASMMKRGCWGRSAGPELISEHGVWFSLFSGVSRAKHGYYYFRQLRPGTYDLEAVSGLDLDVYPFWHHLRGRQKRAAIVDVPYSRCLPGLPGIQLLNWATHDPLHPELFTPASEPPGLLQEVYKNFGPRLTTAEKTDSSFTEDRRIFRQSLDHVAKKGALCRYLLAKGHFDVVVVVFAESHAAGHQFWKYSPEVATGAVTGESELSCAIRDVYQAIDRQMGLLLAQLPAEANAFIVSSIGMEDDYPTTGLIKAFCRQLGYQSASEHPSFSVRTLEWIRKMSPESWRGPLSRHLPREKAERMLAYRFRNGTSWRNTTAFPIPSFYTSFLRVNLRGREPEGIVEPGSPYEALLDRMEADLSQLMDPQTSEPAVTRVARAIDLFGRDPHPSLPDLFVEWKPGRFMRRVAHPRAELTQSKPGFFRRSDHSAQGFFAAAGPSILNRGQMADLSPLDLAPTFLRLMGEAVPKELTGKVIEAMIAG